MRVFNRILAAIISLALIAGSVVGILYLIGLLAGAPRIIQLVNGWVRTISELSTGNIQAILLGILAVSVILLVLEVRPWRAVFIPIRDDSMGRTSVRRADVETYILQRLSRVRGVGADRVDVIVHENRFDVATNVSASLQADRREVREQIEGAIKSNLASIGLDEEIERIDTRIQRVRRVA